MSYKKGERILVRHDSKDLWTSRLFDSYDKDGRVFCVIDTKERLFLNGADYTVLSWRYSKKKPL